MLIRRHEVVSAGSSKARAFVKIVTEAARTLVGIAHLVVVRGYSAAKVEHFAAPSPRHRSDAFHLGGVPHSAFPSKPAMRLGVPCNVRLGGTSSPSCLRRSARPPSRAKGVPDRRTPGWESAARSSTPVSGAHHVVEPPPARFIGGLGRRRPPARLPAHPWARSRCPAPPRNHPHKARRRGWRVGEAADTVPHEKGRDALRSTHRSSSDHQLEVPVAPEVSTFVCRTAISGLEQY